MSKAGDNIFGTATSVADAVIFDDAALPGARLQEDRGITDEGNALWSYHNEGRINGIPVEPAARNMKIDSDDMLSVAFVLDRKPCSEIFYMSPDNEDGIARYDAILGKVYNGEAVVIEENKQYDAQKGSYLLWIRYDLLSYRLHPRFEYLTKE